MKLVPRILALAIAASFATACAEQPGKKKDDEKSKDGKDDKKDDKKAEDKKAEVDPPKKE